jgi:hypothetical protein
MPAGIGDALPPYRAVMPAHPHRDDRQTAIAPDADLSPGRSFPAVTLPSIRDGRRLSITDFRGSKLLLHLFASW